MPITPYPRRRLPLLLSTLLGAALSLTACGDSDSDSTADGAQDKDGGFVIGISNPQGAQPVLKAVQDSFTAAAERDGMTVKALDAQLNPSKQVTDIDQFVAQHVDAIVVYPLDANSLTPALNRAKVAGIKLIGWAATLDREPSAEDIAPYDTNFDTGGAYRGAELLANHVKEQLQGNGNALGVGLGVPVQALELMVDNYEKNVTTDSQVEWLGKVSNPTDDIAGAQKVVTDALTKNQNNVQAVLAYNDSSALGASIALKNAGVEGAIVVGQNGDSDGAAAVADGRISATVDLVPWREGLIMEVLAKTLLAGKEVPVWTENPSELYTRDNIDQRLDWSDALSQIKSGDLTCANGGGCPDAITALDD